jgi:GNAT superfamily N-acetyltransferase
MSSSSPPRASVSVRPVDPADETALHAVWRVARAAHDLRPHNTYWAWEPFAAMQRTPRSDLDTVLLAAYDDHGTAVGMVELQLFGAANPHLAAADLHVHPDHRRRGIGTALLAELERRVTEAERTALLMEVFVTPGAPSPGREFAQHHGYSVAMEEGFKACDLRATEGRWAALESEAARRHDGYRIVTWQRRVPEDLVAAYCRLQSVFLEEAPLGEMEIQAEAWDAKRVRERDDRLEGAGRHQIGAVAVTADGSPAGLCELSVAQADPAVGMQGITLVLPEHRGHRLGMALKIATQRALRTAEPRCTHVFTDNADVNVHMNAVNDQLGFVTVEHLLELQKTWPRAE